MIKEKLLRTDVFVKAEKVMFYYPLDGEVNTREMMRQAYNLGKIIAVPSTLKRRAIRPCLFKPGMRLKCGLYGTKEPATKKFIHPRDIDLVIVPGVAFDQKGNRLGRGKGCYDIFLKKLPKKTPTLGLAFDFQILPFIPATSQDIRLKRVLFA
jgi:5-formyltetrahydrofolate cyclo-ligase